MKRLSARIIPAYAGSTGRRRRRCRGPRDHPRIRGEHDQLEHLLPPKLGSSPHTRGAPADLIGYPEGPRIIPAYAGSTPRPRTVPPCARDHPRIRGEHAGLNVNPRSDGGSSPHTRGAQNNAESETNLPWIIPAYAGSTLGNPCNTKDRRRDYTSFPLPVTHPSGGGGS